MLSFRPKLCKNFFALSGSSFRIWSDVLSSSSLSPFLLSSCVFSHTLWYSISSSWEKCTWSCAWELSRSSMLMANWYQVRQLASAKVGSIWVCWCCLGCLGDGLFRRDLFLKSTNSSSRSRTWSDNQQWDSYKHSANYHGCVLSINWNFSVIGGS